MRGVWGLLVVVAGLGLVGYAVRGADEKKENQKVDTRVFELRTYYAAPGKMDALHKRFRDHTCKLLFIIDTGRGMGDDVLHDHRGL